MSEAVVKKLREMFPAQAFEATSDALSCEHPADRRVLNGFTEICGRCGLGRPFGGESDVSEPTA